MWDAIVGLRLRLESARCLDERKDGSKQVQVAEELGAGPEVHSSQSVPWSTEVGGGAPRHPFFPYLSCAAVAGWSNAPNSDFNLEKQVLH